MRVWKSRHYCTLVPVCAAIFLIFVFVRRKSDLFFFHFHSKSVFSWQKKNIFLIINSNFYGAVFFIHPLHEPFNIANKIIYHPSLASDDGWLIYISYDSWFLFYILYVLMKIVSINACEGNNCVFSV
jgi:hypothetical protein